MCRGPVGDGANLTLVFLSIIYSPSGALDFQHAKIDKVGINPEMFLDIYGICLSAYLPPKVIKNAGLNLFIQYCFLKGS